jgi:transcriptional antiterminator NusG
MTFFVIQVRTGEEGRYLKQAEKRLPLPEQRLWWPRRALRVRRRGRWIDEVASIFPGYVFLQSDRLSPELYWALKQIEGFGRFLKDNQHIEPLNARDQAVLQHFLAFGQVVERSRVVFDLHKKIKVLAGPLEGLEGRIIKVDRRKGRARVRLELYENSFLIDFGFDALEASS